MGFSDGTRPGKHTREAIEAMVDLPIENGDFPEFFVCLPEGTHPKSLRKSLQKLVSRW